MTDQLHYRRYEKTDVPKLSRLVKKVLGTTRNQGYWEWKYHNNPAGPALSAVALKGERIVGHLGAIPVRFWVNGREVVGVQEVDLAIDKQDRASGLYIKLARMRHDINRKEGVAFKYSFSTEATSIIGQKILGFQRVTVIPRLVKVLDVEPLLCQKFSVKGVIRWLSPLVNGALKLAYPIPKRLPPEGTELKEIIISYMGNFFDVIVI